MHYKNGREAKNGAVAGNNDCNGYIAVTSHNDRCPDLKECLHLDDVLAAVNADPKLQPEG